MFAGPIAYRLAKGASQGGPSTVTVLRGKDILAGPYPQRFDDFIGQGTIKDQILAAIIASARLGAPMDHMLLASGIPGIGKTALGRLAAECRDVGFVELGGKVKDKDVAAALRAMEDGDVLFLDEVHRLGAAGSEWLLTLLQDGTLHLPTGVVQAPKITVIAATTDAQKLPKAVLERFPIKPILQPYTLPEAVRIARLQATRLGFGDDVPMPEGDNWLQAVANACINNPRRMTMLLTAVRNHALATNNSNYSPTGYDITTALEWAGLTHDGLTVIGQEYLVALFSKGGTASITTLQNILGEPQLRHDEAELMQRGYVDVSGRGRVLTEYGAERAQELATEMVKKMEASA